MSEQELACQNNANCGDYCITPREREMMLCEGCLDSYDQQQADQEELRTLRAENGRLRQQLAQSDAALRESRANDMASMRTLEAARGLLAQLRGMINCTVENDTDKMPVWISTKHPVIERIDAFLTATPAPEVRCNKQLQAAGKPYQRTCSIACGLSKQCQADQGERQESMNKQHRKGNK